MARQIVVAGATYRWTVARRPSYSQVLGSPLTFAAELAESPAARLVVTLPVARPGNALGRPSAVVTPSLVARCIVAARRSGWHPDRRGPVFHLRASELLHR